MVNIRSIFKRLNESVCKAGHTGICNGYHSDNHIGISATNQYVIEPSECRKLSYDHRIVGRDWFSFFRDRNDKRNQDKQTRRDKIKNHCDILISNYITFNRAFYPDRTLGNYLSQFSYWESIRQHFQTGHDDIYQPLARAIQSHDRMTDLEHDENYIQYEHELKKLFAGYNINTRVLGGACDECLQYHDKKARKKYEQILSPNS